MKTCRWQVLKWGRKVQHNIKVRVCSAGFKHFIGWSWLLSSWQATDIQPAQQSWGFLCQGWLAGLFCHLFLCVWAASTYPKRPPSLLHQKPSCYPCVNVSTVWWVVMTTGLPAANLPGIGFVPPLIGAQQPPGLHRCSQTTLWWSFIADSSVSKSLLLSSLFWFMYSLIYLCMWTRGGEERWQKRRGEERGRQRQLQCLLLYPGERLRYICLLKASATDKHCTATECYKALSVAPKPPTQSQPPSWVNRHCMHVLYAQTKKVVFQLRPGSLKRVKRCCSPLWELQKPKGEEKDTQGVTATSESSTKKERSDQSRDFAHNLLGFHLSLPVSETSRGEPLEGSGRTGTEKQTNLLRKEGGLQRLHSHKERISRWDADPVASPLFLTAIKQISWGWTRHFGTALDFWHCSGI